MIWDLSGSHLSGREELGVVVLGETDPVLGPGTRQEEEQQGDHRPPSPPPAQT